METSEPLPPKPPPSRLHSLTEMFTLQDKWQQSNWEQAPAEFVLIERGLVLAFDLTFWINEDLAVVATRKALPSSRGVPENVGANLLHAAFGTLVSATRLSLFGDFVDAFSLARTAFEAVFHAEYFRDHPDRAFDWNQIGLVTDVFDVRKQLNKFESKEKIRIAVRDKYADGSHDRFFVELSTYGTHINPKTVGLRLGTPRPNAGNLGFVTAGYTEAPVLCASHILHVLAYALSEFRDTFKGYLANSNASLESALNQFEADWYAHLAATGSRTLSLMQ